jgi:hypothetical protein
MLPGRGYRIPQEVEGIADEYGDNDGILISRGQRKKLKKGRTTLVAFLPARITEQINHLKS